MPESPDLLLLALPLFPLAMALEWLSYRLRPDHTTRGYRAKDTATSITMGFGSLVTDALWRVPVAVGYLFLYGATPVHWTAAWWTWPLVMLAQDLTCYVQHRAHHRVRVLWASHNVHHSSELFNLSTAVRQTWTALAVGIFHLPMALLGVPPAMVLTCGYVSLVYQFFLHTERIGRLPAPVEWLFNTPSHHRVHHSANGGYLDRNFGCVLIVWDRLFGTFAAETVPCVYGLTKNVGTYNPLRVAFHEYAAMIRDVRGARSWSQRWGHVLAAPGWTPSAPATEPGSSPPTTGPVPVPPAAGPVPTPPRAEPVRVR